VDNRSVAGVADRVVGAPDDVSGIVVAVRTEIVRC
jgi:hypothetical protein